MTLADIGLAQRSGVLTVQHRCTGLSLNEYFDQQVRLHEQLKLNPNKSVPAKDLEEARKERELERESKETMELQFQFRKQVQQEVNSAIEEQNQQKEIEERYRKRVEQENPHTDEERRMIYTQVAAKVRSTHERTIETKIFEKKLQEPPSVEQPNVPDRDVRVFLPPCDTRSVSPDLGGIFLLGASRFILLCDLSRLQRDD
eukprot:TRINITY_DN797_c0_g2_i30.p1 TRINITY_DN797_c0_g2~~TRINITY_DN797_c0_g2_i30.p1  ORF type:complete len:201 (-),score=50.01 TRINITY_DN797_c0_g2_i30:903-1505(-)